MEKRASLQEEEKKYKGRHTKAEHHVMKAAETEMLQLQAKICQGYLETPEAGKKQHWQCKLLLIRTEWARSTRSSPDTDLGHADT